MRNMYPSELPDIPLKKGATKPNPAGIVACLPNTTVSLGLNRSAPVIYTPLSPSRTRAVQSFYFVSDAATDDKLAEARERAIDRAVDSLRFGPASRCVVQIDSSPFAHGAPDEFYHLQGRSPTAASRVCRWKSRRESGVSCAGSRTVAAVPGPGSNEIVCIDRPALLGCHYE